MKHPIASWLFQRLSLDVALAGDILEENERGHSRIWYAAAALGVGLYGALCVHKLVSLRPMATRTTYDLGPVVGGEPFCILVTQSAASWVARTHRA